MSSGVGIIIATTAHRAVVLLFIEIEKCVFVGIDEVKKHVCVFSGGCLASEAQKEKRQKNSSVSQKKKETLLFALSPSSSSSRYITNTKHEWSQKKKKK